jgi:hypothetical protein
MGEHLPELALFTKEDKVKEACDGTFIACLLNKLHYSPKKLYACHQHKYQSLDG